MTYNVPVYIDVTAHPQFRGPEAESLMSRRKSEDSSAMEDRRHSPRYPYCIVWTPIPLLTWIFPFIGHMGICTSQGVIRDFAGPYHVSEDSMAFGNPTRIWKLNPDKVTGTAWDAAISEAAEVYKTRMHNLCCDNCHSMVAMALNKMKYDGSTSWNMVKLCFLTLIYGKYVSIRGAAWSLLPFLIILSMIVGFCVMF